MEQVARRTCSNCCSYEAGECWNGLGAVDDHGRCEHHETQAEFDSDVAAIRLFRQRIGLPPKEAA